MNQVFDPNRRRLLRGDLGGRRAPIRPPWSVTEAAFVGDCTRCEACVTACPEAVLRVGLGGYPEIDFGRGECTFCGECARVCKAPVFGDRTPPPWDLQAQIGEGCLANRQVVCRSCGEACESEAIRFVLEGGGLARPEIESERCTGCGACIRVCPTEAVAVRPPVKEVIPDVV